jgi:membrane protease YdiL (CAAX protease family)
VSLRTQTACPDDLASPKPFWGYEDIGIFFLVLVLLTAVFRVLVRFHVLRGSDLANPSAGLQFGLVAFLSVTLYLVLKLRHHQPVVRPLGWVLPSPAYIVAALILGSSFASAVALYVRLRNQSTPPMPLLQLLVLGLVLGPILEESLFRGCLLPVLAQTTGSVVAVIMTALLFALFHGPADLAHWVSFTATGLVYGWLRVSSVRLKICSIRVSQCCVAT